MLHCFYRKEESWVRRWKALPLATEVSPPIKINRTWTNKKKSFSVYGIIVPSFYWLLENDQVLFQSHFTFFQSTVQEYDFLIFQRKNGVVCRLRTRFCYSDCERFDPRNDNGLPRFSSSSLDLALVSKTTIFRQSFTWNPNHSQPARNAWNEGRCSL